jgi:uncharacterized protein YlzI (FlbEa/FlbD family)
MTKFIRLTASFATDSQPDFEKLNIQASPEDMQASDWSTVSVNIAHIQLMHINHAGFTNIQLQGGSKWSVKESVEEIEQLIEGAIEF